MLRLIADKILNQLVDDKIIKSCHACSQLDLRLGLGEGLGVSVGFGLAVEV